VYVDGNPVYWTDSLGLAPGDRHPAPRGTFKNPRKAAEAAGKAARAISPYVEFGCLICPTSDGFKLTDFVEGTPVEVYGEDMGKLQAEQCPTASGDFHAHPFQGLDFSEIDKPSPEDLDSSKWLKKNTTIKKSWLFNSGNKVIMY